MTLPSFEVPEKTYFNTTHLSPADGLIEAQDRARHQNVNILSLFRKYSPMSPSMVWARYRKEYGEVLLTSIRRAITTMTKQGLLVKTSVKVKGIYEKPEYVWKLA